MNFSVGLKFQNVSGNFRESSKTSLQWKTFAAGPEGPIGTPGSGRLR